MESVLWYSLEVAISFYQGFIEIYFISGFLTPKADRDNRTVFILCSCFLGGLQSLMDYFVPVGMAVAALCHVAALFIYSLLRLNGSVIKKLFASVIPPLLILLVSTGVLSIHYYIYQFIAKSFSMAAHVRTIEEMAMEPGISRLIALVLVQVALFGLVKLILKIYQSLAGGIDGRSVMEWILVFFVLVVSASSMYLMQQTRRKPVQRTSRKELDFLVLIVVMDCVLILIMIYALGRYYQQQREIDNIQKSKLYLKRELEVMRQAQLKMDCLRHDMKNHLYCIEVMAKEKKVDEILEYLERGMEYLKEDAQYVSTGNKNIDCMLNFKLDKAKKENITFTTQIALSGELDIDSFDINTILGNLLDNAMEAIGKTSDKKLDITIKYEKNILTIKIGNSFNGKLSENLRTTKTNPSKHGLGLKSVQLIVKKYHGLLQYDYDSDYFVTKVLLYDEGKFEG